MELGAGRTRLGVVGAFPGTSRGSAPGPQWSHRPPEAGCAVLKPISRALGMAAEASMVEGPPHPPHLCRDHRTARTGGVLHLLTKEPGHCMQQERLDGG